MRSIREGAVRRWPRGAPIASCLAACFAAGLLALGISCLPDITPATIGASDAAPSGPTSVVGTCGDGVIDLDAGETCDPSDASAIGCVDCHVVCDGGLVDDASNHCYFALPGTGKVEAAQKACENAGAHVVTFASERELGLVSAGVAPPYWVGLEFATAAFAYAPLGGVEEPGWSGRCSGCYAHVDAGAQDFASDDGGPRPTGCVVADSPLASPWRASPCDVTDAGAAPSVMCEREPAGGTAHPCVGATCLELPVTFGKKSYLYFPTPASAKDALDGCRSIGGTLVVFATREEREKLARELAAFLPKSPAPRVWIGLSLVGTGWQWVSGELAAELPDEWAEGEPSQGDWAWLRLSVNDYDTSLAHTGEKDAPLPYVCERPRF